MKPSGSLFYNHKDIIYKGLIVPPKWVYDFKVRQQIIWDLQSSPMLDPHYFMPANEWVYWVVKDEKKVFSTKAKVFLEQTFGKLTENITLIPHLCL